MQLPIATFKNLRDEFDPLHSNQRKGWHLRPIRPNRERVFRELKELSDDAVLELVERILKREEETIVEAIDSLVETKSVVYNVAERLLTGRKAEEYFISHSSELINIDAIDLMDMRQSAVGFDFGVRTRPEWAIEVKGLKLTKGDIQFTDREWREARERRTNYWLIVVGNIAANPKGKVIINPHDELSVSCSYQQTISAIWRSKVEV